MAFMSSLFCILLPMGGEGSMSAMISSLKNNNRRGRREHFEKQSGFPIEETDYDFPVVSEEERKKVVEKILRKRQTEQIAVGIALGLLGLFFLLFLVSVFT